jgi:hypothetical protein
VADGLLEIIPYEDPAKVMTLPQLSATAKQRLARAMQFASNFTLTKRPTGKATVLVKDGPDGIDGDALRHELAHAVSTRLSAADVTEYVAEIADYGDTLLQAANDAKGDMPVEVKRRVKLLESSLRRAHELEGEKGVQDFVHLHLAQAHAEGFGDLGSAGKTTDAQYNKLSLLIATAKNLGVRLPGSYGTGEAIAYRAGADLAFFDRMSAATHGSSERGMENGIHLDARIDAKNVQALEDDKVPPKEVRDTYYVEKKKHLNLPTPWQRLTQQPAETVKGIAALRVLASHRDVKIPFNTPEAVKEMSKEFTKIIQHRLQFDRKTSGIDFYPDFHERFVAGIESVHGKLTVAEKKLLATVVAISSNQTTVAKNGPDGYHAWSKWKETGEVPITGPYLGTKSANGTAESKLGWGGMGDSIVADGMHRVNGLIKHFGSLERATDWLYTQHPVVELRSVARELFNNGGWSRTKGKSIPQVNALERIDQGKDKQFGTVLFGPKVGRFAPNLVGEELAPGASDTPTIDRHIAAFATVLLGHRDFPVVMDKSRGDWRHNIDVTNDMRHSVDKALRIAAKKTGMSVADAQAITWAGWKELWDHAGSTRDVKVNYGDTLKDIPELASKGRPEVGVVRPDVSAASVGRRVSTETAQSIIDKTKADGGGTWSGNDYQVQDFKEGYQVGYHPNDFNVVEGIDLATATPEAIIDAFGKMPADAKFVGTWMDKGRLFLDPSTHIADRVEAIDMAKKNNQRGVWDWANMDSIKIEGTNGERETPEQRAKRA